MRYTHSPPERQGSNVIPLRRMTAGAWTFMTCPPENIGGTAAHLLTWSGECFTAHERRFLVELVRRQPRRLRWEAAEALARMCDRARLPGSVA